MFTAIKEDYRTIKRMFNNKKKDAAKRPSLPSCSTDGGPLTPSQRVDRLFDKNEFPTYEEIESVIWDAEFDTLQWHEIIARRHGQSRL